MRNKMKNLFPGPLSVVAFLALVALAILGVVTLITEPEYPEAGWFLIALGAAGISGYLYYGSKKGPR